MNIYTKNGDAGMTSIVKTKNIPKSDERIQLLGTIDELTSHLGLVKAEFGGEKVRETLEHIQQTLITVMAGIADPHNIKYRLKDTEAAGLEEEIDRMEGLFDRKKEFVLPGENRLSAQIDVARTVARRAERCLALVSIRYGSDAQTKKYMNRLADYLYVLARYTDAVSVTEPRTAEMDSAAASNGRAAGTDSAAASGQAAGMGGVDMSAVSQEVVQEVLKRMGQTDRISLDSAKKLIEKIEEHSRRSGMQSVIAVCGPDGNPIAVHVMDNAFLVSFDVAVKKAYTSVAVKMSTKELSVLAQPGGTFYGVDKMDGGKIVIFGGGVPLKIGDKIIGGLGISGGTGEQDHALAEYGLSVLSEVL
ncbi:cob(I)yrinic acid a,c-diamide adenosyltransferase [Murimonas intestini]|uniref:Corrinoid adenosyltransferase n=1 Tax=Murimonas intestini TaxID=1337051 RepID=A0AB73SXR8_9FIRM|nr:cob(I)yrinic acid a,c-diamide adenosyltransferase [Murimonas intestini]MCR1843308.1 cob(I)yrinic acid a,c-diamide adenosyltransferase [Murimonas intestini]MCR1865741.1 cob(I)yrinic acid a,c-diamide adenosyltransferase [Murimonas intestini]MCR1886140.1 cob(I)yrinic acid a,c-diamide adenosyltransferase [Murimonas intestini]